MKHKNLFALTLMLVSCFVIESLAAQTLNWRRGPRRGRAPRHAERHVMPQLGVLFGHEFYLERNVLGGHLVLPIGRFWEVVPAFKYSLGEFEHDAQRWQFNGDVVFNPRHSGGLYFGGGVAAAYFTSGNDGSDMQFAPNALVGLEIGRTPMKVFIQSRWAFFDDTHFSVLAGLRLALR